MSQADVFGGADIGSEIEFLVDDPYPQGERPLWTVDGDGPSLNFDGAAIGMVDTGQDFHQGRFARPVLTDERVNLALAHFQMHIP